MEFNLKLVAQHTIFLHGLSGSGKSVVQQSLENRLKSAVLQLIYLSSGDCFRALAKLDPKLASRMSQGHFIQTLEGAMPKLEETIEQFLKDLVSCQKELPVLILDGFLRRGVFESEGQQIPSQTDQVAQAFVKVFNKLGLGSFTVEEVAKSVVKAAWHCYVDVSDADAESLMRIRSEKQLSKLVGDLQPFLQNEEINKLSQLLSSAVKVQTGGEHDFRLKEVPKEMQLKLDQQMDMLIMKIFELADMEKGEGTSLAKPVQKLLEQNKVLGVKVSFRDDDLTYKSRMKRVTEFNTGTKKGMLVEQLGFKMVNGQIADSADPKLKVIPNGPSRKISLEELEKKCDQEAGKIASEILGLSKAQI